MTDALQFEAASLLFPGRIATGNTALRHKATWQIGATRSQRVDFPEMKLILITMKSAYCLICLVAGVVLAGCGKDDKPATNTTTVQSAPAAPAPAAPGGNSYLGAMVNAQQAAIKTVDVTSLNEEVQLFNVQEGRFPKDLNELVTKQYIGKLPPAPAGKKLVYDAVQGKVTVAPL